MRMLCLMHRSPRRGFLLKQNSEQVTSKWLAEVVGQPEGLINSLKKELEKEMVFSRNEHGTIYSRRMRREAELAEHRSRAGRKGGKAKAKQEASKGSGKSEANCYYYYYYNVVASSSDNGSTKEVVIPPNLEVPEFLKAWADWVAHRAETKKPLKIGGARIQLKHLSEIGPVEAVARIERSIENDWQGLFFPNEQVPVVIGKAPAVRKTFDQIEIDAANADADAAFGGGKTC
jgi:hypothetical protein